MITAHAALKIVSAYANQAGWCLEDRTRGLTMQVSD